jgi:hypothetical protein
MSLSEPTAAPERKRGFGFIDSLFFADDDEKANY